MGLLEQLAGDGEEKKPWDRKPEKKSRGRGRSRDTSTGDRPQSRGQKNVRPPEVSENVWGLAEQWLEMGEAHFGKSLQVNRQNFAKRLAVKINGDKNLRSWLSRKPDFWQRLGKWEDGHEFLNAVLAKMLDLFWEHITEGQKNTPAIQFDFLDTEWDEWVYQAVTAVQVGWLKEHSTWEKPTMPTAVFDPATVGQPADDEPCTDPEFPGMTWGEVRALREADNESLGTLSDDDVQQAYEDDTRQHQETFATLKGAMVANRETTTKEHTR